MRASARAALGGPDRRPAGCAESGVERAWRNAAARRVTTPAAVPRAPRNVRARVPPHPNVLCSLVRRNGVDVRYP
eukprot:264244-Prymnesium_polylepis.1